MSDHDHPTAPEAPPEEVPLGQRLMDRPFVLMAFGFAVMLIFFTLWGLWEIRSLPVATLP